VIFGSNNQYENSIPNQYSTSYYNSNQQTPQCVMTISHNESETLSYRILESQQKTISLKTKNNQLKKDLESIKTKQTNLENSFLELKEENNTLNQKLIEIEKELTKVTNFQKDLNDLDKKYNALLEKFNQTLKNKMR